MGKVLFLCRQKNHFTAGECNLDVQLDVLVATDAPGIDDLEFFGRPKPEFQQVREMRAVVQQAFGVSEFESCR